MKYLNHTIFGKRLSVMDQVITYSNMKNYVLTERYIFTYNINGLHYERYNELENMFLGLLYDKVKQKYKVIYF